MKKIKTTKIRLCKETISVLQTPELVAGGDIRTAQRDCVTLVGRPGCALTDRNC